MSHRVGSWSQEEDDCLLRAIQAEGARNWRRIAQLVGTRSRIQCRSRYQQYLNPTLNNNPITLEEGLLIERLVSEKGRRFREISRKLDGRSDGAIKNWWYKRNRRRYTRSVYEASSSPRLTGNALSLLPEPEVTGTEPLNKPSSLDSDLGSANSTLPRATISLHHAVPDIDQRVSFPLPSPRSTSLVQDLRTGARMSFEQAALFFASISNIPKDRLESDPIRSEGCLAVAVSNLTAPRIRLPPLQLGTDASIERDSRMELSTILD